MMQYEPFNRLPGAEKRRRRWIPWVIGVVSMAGLWAYGAGGASPLSSLESLVGEWSRLRTAVADERRAWTEQQTQWRAELALLQRERHALRQTIDGLSSEQESEETARRSSLEKEAELTGMLDGVEPLLGEAEADLRAWPDRLPPPMRTPLEAAFRQLPDDGPATIARSTGARLQTIIALYSEIEKLQQEFHLFKQILPLPDGSRKELDVLYLGLATAFAVSVDGGYAAIGTPTDSGWTWTEASSMAGPIGQAIAIHRRELPAAMTRLPLTVEERPQ